MIFYLLLLLFLTHVECLKTMHNIHIAYYKNYVENDTVLNFLWKNEKKILNKTMDLDKLSEKREQFVSMVEKHQNNVNVNFLLGMYGERKRYCLANQNSKIVFFDDETFERVSPYIFKENLLQKLWTCDGLKIITFSNPYLMNRLIYDYKLFEKDHPREQSGIVGNTIIWFCNCTAELLNKTICNGTIQKTPYKIPTLVDWIEGGLEVGYWIDDAAYHGARPFVADYNLLVELPHMQNTTNESEILYLKTLLKPQVYRPFKPQEKVSDVLKPRLFSLFCCLKIMQLKVPKPVLQLIYNDLALYENAQRVRPFILRQIELCKEYQETMDVPENTTLNFIRDRLLDWFDEEAQR